MKFEWEQIDEKPSSKGKAAELLETELKNLHENQTQLIKLLKEVDSLRAKIEKLSKKKDQKHEIQMGTDR